MERKRWHKDIHKRIEKNVGSNLDAREASVFFGTFQNVLKIKRIRKLWIIFIQPQQKKSNDEREITMESAPVQSKMAAVTNEASGRISKPTSIDSLETNTNRGK